LAQILANIPQGADADILWGPDLQIIEVPLDGDGAIKIESDVLVSAQELRDALVYIRKNREVKQNESSQTVG
jgi:hypothetical protein